MSIWGWWVTLLSPLLWHSAHSASASPTRKKPGASPAWGLWHVPQTTPSAAVWRVSASGGSPSRLPSANQPRTRST